MAARYPFSALGHTVRQLMPRDECHTRKMTWNFIYEADASRFKKIFHGITFHRMEVSPEEDAEAAIIAQEEADFDRVRPRRDDDEAKPKHPPLRNKQGTLVCGMFCKLC